MKHCGILAVWLLVLLITSTKLFAARGLPDKRFRITIQPPRQHQGDTLLLKYWPVYFNDVYMREEDRLPSKRSVAVTDGEGKAVFDVACMDQPGYLSIYGLIPTNLSSSDRQIAIIDKYLFEKGDDVLLKLSAAGSTPENSYAFDSICFSGKGAAKYTYAYLSDLLEKTDFGFRAAPFDPTDKVHGLFIYYANSLRRLDALAEKKMHMLASFSLSMSKLAADILKADIMGECRGKQLNVLLRGNNTDSFHLKAKDAVYHHFFKYKRPADLLEISPLQAVLISKNTASYLITDVIKRTGGTPGMTSYQELYSLYKGELRSRLLTAYIYAYLINHEYPEKLLIQSEQDIPDLPYSDWVRQLRLTLSKETDAFNFQLPDENGRIVRLSDFKGKVVLIDFWFTGCTACKSYYNNILREVEEYFSNRVVFISISIDSDRAAWLKSVSSGLYTGEGVVNLYTGGLGQDHDVIRHYQVKGYPRPVLIGKSGKIITTSDRLLRLDGKQQLMQQLEAALAEL